MSGKTVAGKTFSARGAAPQLRLSLQNAAVGTDRTLAPSRQRIARWARAALRSGAAEVTIRLVGETEGRELNRDFRGKDYATNVLTFVYGDDAMDEGGQDNGEAYQCAEDHTDTAVAPARAHEVNPPACDATVQWWGDLVLCVPVVAREATEQGKALDAHFAHLIVHGMLHLQGFDHEAPGPAEEMEALESHILMALGYASPYA